MLEISFGRSPAKHFVAGSVSSRLRFVRLWRIALEKQRNLPAI